MKSLFWLCFLIVVYCYCGYPVIVAGLSRMRPRAIRKGEIQPTISVVISVYNEQDVIKRKLENLLNVDYPKEKMEILIGSDGSTDQTNSIIQDFSDLRIHLLVNSSRLGKAATLNDLVSRARGEIIVFTDARQIFAPDAIKELAKNFADPVVGCVSGELLFMSKEIGGTGKGINLYWEYEKGMRSCESRLHSMLGATGAIYAIRKNLYTILPDDIVLDDMFTPLKIIEKGYRAIFDTAAKAYDHVADTPQEEHRRKSRTLFGNYQIFRLFWRMFLPWKSPIAIQLFSHKFLRVVVPFFLIMLFILNLMLLRESFYATIFFIQLCFYGLALMGALLRNHKCGMLGVFSKVSYAPYVFCLLNFSALIGFFRFVNSRQKVTWEKARDIRA